MALYEWFASHIARTKEGDNQASHPIVHERDRREGRDDWKQIGNQRMMNISFQTRHRRTSY